MNFSAKLPIIIISLGLAALTGCGKKKFKPKNLKPVKTEYADYIDKHGDLEIRAKKLQPSRLKRCFRWHVRKNLSQFQVVQMTFINNGEDLYAVDKKQTDIENLSLEEVYPQVKYRASHFIGSWILSTGLTTAFSAMIMGLAYGITWPDVGIMFGVYGGANLLTIPYTKSSANKHVYKQLRHVAFTSESIVKPKEEYNALLFFPLDEPLNFSIGLKNRTDTDDRPVFDVKLEAAEEAKEAE